MRTLPKLAILVPRNQALLRIVVLVLVLGVGVEVAHADFTFGAPQDLGLGSGGYISVSTDELELYFTSNRAGGLGREDIWVSTRQSVDDPWGPPTNLQTINSSYREGFPCISHDGLTLYFSDYYEGPDRPGGQGGHDLWFSTRASRNDPWGAPVNMGAPFSRPGYDISPTISRDGLTFIFATGGPVFSVNGNYDLWMCTRPSVQEAWGAPVNMGPRVNSSSHEHCGNLSPDGLVLFFESSNRGGSYKVWMTMRRTINDPWEPPIPIIEPMNWMGVGCVSADGSMFYAGMSQVPILPIVDLNGDGIVEAADISIMVNYWGTNEPLCDIGPMPWGDGIVDVQDLEVLIEYIEPIDRTLIAHWALDEAEGEIAQDSTVGDNDAYVIGDLLWQPEVGKVGGALQFDGINDYVGTPFVLNPREESFSVTAWIRGGSPGQVIISQADVDGQGPLESGSTWLGIDPVDGRLMTGLMDIFYGPLESESVVTDGQWHHVGLVYDITTMKRHLYVDGAEVAVDDGIVAGVQSTAGLHIGAGQTLDASTFFSGLIDDVRIYNRVVNP